jgi:hypothetical protein
MSKRLFLCVAVVAITMTQAASQLDAPGARLSLQRRQPVNVDVTDTSRRASRPDDRRASISVIGGDGMHHLLNERHAGLQPASGRRQGVFGRSAYAATGVGR